MELISGTHGAVPSTAITTAPDTEVRPIAQWLHGRSPHVQAAYRAAVRDFRAYCEVPLNRLTLGELQAWADTLGTGSPAPASRALKLTAIKSLLSFGHRLGVLPVNVGAALRVPARRSRLAERILAESYVALLWKLETNPRNRALLPLLSAGGLRVSELSALAWRDLQPRGDAGQVTVFGKGTKERTVLLPAAIWAELRELRGDAGDEAPVFPSRVRAGITAKVSPHSLRHALASHALDCGAPLHVVQSTLGHTSIATTGRYPHARPGDSAGNYVAV